MCESQVIEPDFFAGYNFMLFQLPPIFSLLYQKDCILSVNSNVDCKYAHGYSLRDVHCSLEVASVSPICTSFPKQGPIDTIAFQTSVMSAPRYAPLHMKVPLHELPQDYGRRLPKFDSTGKVTT